MNLLINGACLRITEMGPDFLLIDADQPYGACQATVVLRVNASERRWDVYLPQGISAGGIQEVAAAQLDGQAAR